MPSILQSVLGRNKSPKESCWNTSILRIVSAIIGYREGQFILRKKKKDYGSDIFGPRYLGLHEAKVGTKMYSHCR